MKAPFQSQGAGRDCVPPSALAFGVSASEGEELRLADVKQIFVQIRDHVAFCASFPWVPKLPFGQTAGQNIPKAWDEEPMFLSLLPNPPGRLWPGFIVRDFADGAPVAYFQAVPSDLATERRCEFCSRHARFPGRVERHQAR
jgi:hypothetical protein